MTRIIGFLKYFSGILVRFESFVVSKLHICTRFGTYLVLILPFVFTSMTVQIVVPITISETESADRI